MSLKTAGLLIPLLLLIALIGIAPLGDAVYSSFFHDIHGQRSFAGWENYRAIVTDRAFGMSLAITLLWAMLNAILSVGIGFIAAVILARRTRRFPRTLYAALLVPWGIPIYIAVPIWRAIIHGSGGVSILTRLFGIRINLLLQPVAGFLSALAVSLWMIVPLSAFVFLGSLKKVPSAVLEAAAIDGAGEGEIARLIYLPHIRDSLLVIGVLNFLKSFKEFTLLFMMTSGGPPLLRGITEKYIVGATTTTGIYLYDLFYTSEDYGIPAAYAVVVAAVVLIIMLIWLAARRAEGLKGRRYAVSPRPLSATARPLWICSTTLVLLFFIISALLVLYLLIWLSFSAVDAVYFDTLFPRYLSGEAYGKIFSREQIHRYFLNTLLVSGLTALAVPVVTFPAAGALSLARQRFSGGFLTFIQILGISGGMHSLIPLYSLFRKIGLIDSYLPLVLIYMDHAVPFAVFTITEYLRGFPRGLRETADLEGMKPLAYLTKILLPLSIPVILVTMMTAFLGAWNGFMPPLLFLNDDIRYTISVKLYTFVGSIASGSPKWSLFAAASVVNCIIIAGLFYHFRKPLGISVLSHYDDN